MEENFNLLIFFSIIWVPLTSTPSQFNTSVQHKRATPFQPPKPSVLKWGVFGVELKGFWCWTKGFWVLKRCGPCVELRKMCWMVCVELRGYVWNWGVLNYLFKIFKNSRSPKYNFNYNFSIILGLNKILKGC